MEMTMQKIVTVPELIKTLNNSSSETRYLEVLKSVDIPHDEVEKYCAWNKTHYTRVSLFRSDKVELLLICWERGQQSPIHDFRSREAWIHPIHGGLTEQRFRLKSGRLEMVSSMHLSSSEFSFMVDPVAIHRYINGYESRTVTLNLYAGPIDEWTEYDEKTAIPSLRKVKYDWIHKYRNDGSFDRLEDVNRIL
jgi:cysteine dioxygenase